LIAGVAVPVLFFFLFLISLIRPMIFFTPENPNCNWRFASHQQSCQDQECEEFHG